MLHVTTVLFWISLGVLLYTYAVYPLLLLLLTRIKRLFRKKFHYVPTHLPTVTLIVTAYNEEEIIEEKIRNTKKIDYPRPLLHVIFITDGSDDNTVNIIRKHPQFTLLHQPLRQGKLAAMNRAIDHVSSPIVVFSDANGMLNPDCLKNLVKHYSDPRVGAVSGEKRIKKSNAAVGKGEGLYWRYESLVKQLDSDLHTLVGAAGELFSIRTRLYRKLSSNVIIEDFVQSLLLCEAGYVVRYEREAWSEEAPSIDIRDEQERKIRISAGGFQAMGMLTSLLNPFRHPTLTFQYISHRVLRWTACPPALVILLICTIILHFITGHLFYTVILGLQALFYSAAAAGAYLVSRNRKASVFSAPFYFVFMNWCVVRGFSRYLSRRQPSTWKKVRRS